MEFQILTREPHPSIVDIYLLILQAERIKSIIDDEERRYLVTLKKAENYLREEGEVEILSGKHHASCASTLPTSPVPLCDDESKMSLNARSFYLKNNLVRL